MYRAPAVYKAEPKGKLDTLRQDPIRERLHNSKCKLFYTNNEEKRGVYFKAKEKQTPHVGKGRKPMEDSKLPAVGGRETML